MQKPKYPEPLVIHDSWPWKEKDVEDSYDKNINWPKISIVTPSFNQGKFIEQTIRSVLLQNYPNLEYIIIDGGSTDGTVEILHKYSKWITYWVSEPDSGQSNALNKGIVRCTGDIFNWINSDDWYEAGCFLEIATSFLKKDHDIVCAKERWFFQDGDKESIIRMGSTVSDDISQAVFVGHIDQPSTFWRLNCIKRLLPINEQFQYLMDADLWVKYLLLNGASKINFIDKVLVNFRFHSGSKSTKHKAGFLRERWSIRYALVFDCDKKLAVLSSTLKANVQVTYNVPAVLNSSLRRIFADELIREHYSMGNYHDFKKVYLHTLINVSGVRNTLVQYAIRFVIPSMIHRVIRRIFLINLLKS